MLGGSRMVAKNWFPIRLVSACRDRCPHTPACLKNQSATINAMTTVPKTINTKILQRRSARACSFFIRQGGLQNIFKRITVRCPRDHGGGRSQRTAQHYSSGAVEHSVIRCDEFARRLPTSSHGFKRMHQSYLCFGWRKHRARAEELRDEWVVFGSGVPI
jgi:hypothetical protein